MVRTKQAAKTAKKGPVKKTGPKKPPAKKPPVKKAPATKKATKKTGPRKAPNTAPAKARRPVKRAVAGKTKRGKAAGKTKGAQKQPKKKRTFEEVNMMEPAMRRILDRAVEEIGEEKFRIAKDSFGDLRALYIDIINNISRRVIERSRAENRKIVKEEHVTDVLSDLEINTESEIEKKDWSIGDANMQRFIRSSDDEAADEQRFSSSAMKRLHSALEEILIQVTGVLLQIAMHGKRRTLTVADVQLMRNVKQSFC